MSEFKTGLDPRTIGQQRRLLFGNDVFGIVPDKTFKPVWHCDSGGCTRWVDSNNNTSGGECPGYCF